MLQIAPRTSGKVAVIRVTALPSSRGLIDSKHSYPLYVWAVAKRQIVTETVVKEHFSRV